MRMANETGGKKRIETADGIQFDSAHQNHQEQKLIEGSSV
jgi:hypothetical protein